MIRRIVEINQELCNGCGACANACHEDAIAMIHGKATLIKDDYCDGLGDCLPACPTNAISIIEREAAEYDEAEVKRRMAEKNQQQLQDGLQRSADGTCATQSHGCPGSMARSLRAQQESTVKEQKMSTSTNVGQDIASGNQQQMRSETQLQQWPVQIKLMPITAPYYENANLLIAADCTAYAYANFHQDFMKNHITVIGCPKLDAGEYSEKLTEILKNNAIKSVRIVRMEVPCCGGLQNAAVTALQNCGKMIPWQVTTISCTGDILDN